MYKKDDYRERKDNVYLKEDMDLPQRRPRQNPEEYDIEKERVRDRLIRQTMPHSENDKIDKLKLKGSKVIGSIFDRVKFLERRITELSDSLALRKRLHEDIVTNIEKDIEDKNDMLSFISDQNEKRNLKMDVSILRKEKRHEQLQFWKDTTELMTELQDVTEQFETEKKITSIFGDIDENE